MHFIKRKIFAAVLFMYLGLVACSPPSQSQIEETNVSRVAGMYSMADVNVLRNGTAICDNGQLGRNYLLNGVDDTHAWSFNNVTATACVDQAGQIYVHVIHR